jgi:hypothetical protein
MDLRAEALNKFAKGVVTQARANLTRQKKNASKKLYDSMDYETQVYPNSIRLAFFMEPYGLFQDQGVNGKKIKHGSPFGYRDKMPPPSALDKWIVRRGLAPRDEKGRLLPRKTIQWILSRSIYNKGIKPSKFFSNALDTKLKTLPNELFAPYALTAEFLLELTIKENLKNVRTNALSS